MIGKKTFFYVCLFFLSLKAEFLSLFFLLIGLLGEENVRFYFLKVE